MHRDWLLPDRVWLSTASDATVQKLFDQLAPHRECVGITVPNVGTFALHELARELNRRTSATTRRSVL